ncbi:MAG TPA: hypothetical protein VM143_02685 [Acidimicrobiales bacterium]|nr:hypothetical protein [Acidimicrobiales bacterium]
MIQPGIDHIALAVPDFETQLDRLTNAFGMVVDSRFGTFAVLRDPVTGLQGGVEVQLVKYDD